MVDTMDEQRKTLETGLDGLRNRLRRELDLEEGEEGSITPKRAYFFGLLVWVLRPGARGSISVTHLREVAEQCDTKPELERALREDGLDG